MTLRKSKAYSDPSPLHVSYLYDSIKGGSASSPIDSGNSNLNSYDWNNRDEFDDKSSGMGGLNGYDNWSGETNLLSQNLPNLV